MAILYIDPVGGISGDMMLGALVSAGADFEKIKAVVLSVPLADVKMKSKPVKRGVISAIKVTVLDKRRELNEYMAKQGPPTPKSNPDFNVIAEFIGRYDLKPRVKERAIKIFKALADAEKRVHETENAHFHEIGAADSVADIVGTAVALEMLGIDKIYSGPLRLGRGLVKSEHGVLPATAPATAELTKGLPVRFTDAEGEFTTPTGAAIVAALAEKTPMDGDFIVRSIGYGAGDNDYPDVPNVLRVFVGELAGTPGPRMVELSANIDDCPAELIGAAVEKVLAAGAVDAYTISTTMKKSRPGLALEVLVSEDLRPRIEEIIFRETTTLGIRRRYVERTVLRREFAEIDTAYGKVKVKIGFFDGKPVTIKPEYESARKLSEKAGVPLKEIYRIASGYEMDKGGIK
jgi:hypothetical protein